MKAQKGFTLIELMVTIAVLGVLASMAVPSFNEQMAHQTVKQTAYGFANNINEAIGKAQVKKGTKGRSDISLTTSPHPDVTMSLTPSGKEKLRISSSSSSGFGRVVKQVIQGTSTDNVTDLKIKFTHAKQIMNTLCM